MKKFTFIFLVLFLTFCSESFSQYTGGSYDGYSSLSDSDIVIISGIEFNTEEVNDFRLYQNYPNPFNPSTLISYELNKPGLVSLKIFDLTGKETATLLNRKQSAGKYDVIFNAKNIPGGVYFYRISVNDLSITKKMILIK